MALVYTIMSVNWVFSWSPWRSTFMSHANPLSLSKECIVHCRIVYLPCLFMLPSHFVVSSDVQRGSEEFLPLQSTQSLCQYLWVSHMVTTFTSFQNYVPSFMSSMWDSSWPSFDETFSCRHQLIREIVLETIFSNLRYVSLNDRFSLSRHRFTSLTFDR